MSKISDRSFSSKSPNSRVISLDVASPSSLRLLPRLSAHLLEDLARVDELDLALPVLGLTVRHDPDVGVDAGVVEELVGQRDDGFEPVVLDDPAADLALARAGAAREERRAVEDDGDARAALRRRASSWTIMC